MELLIFKGPRKRDASLQRVREGQTQFPGDI